MERNLDVADLRVVLTLAETGSYTRAAQKLGITQPAVSRRITALEQALHVRLFRRDGGRFVPTEAGSAFTDRAVEVLALMEQLTTSTTQFSQEPHGVVSLGLPPTTGELLLPSLAPAYHAQYPDVLLRIEQGYVADLFEMLMDKQVDVALLNGNFSTSAVDLEALFDHHLGVVYPRAWSQRSPLGGRPMPDEISLAELAQLPLLMQSSNQNMRQLVDATFRAAGLKPNIFMEVNSFLFQRKLATTGMGCFVMSRGVLNIDGSDRDKLRFARIADASMVYTMYMATRKAGQPTLAAKLLMKMIRNHIVHVVTQYMGDPGRQG
jgi:LysR family nitrogen assimilation transcriptional regulator